MGRVFEAYRAVHEQGFVPIFVQDDFDSRDLVEACLSAGIRVIEYTLRRPDAPEMIPWIRKTYPDLYLMAGSTLDDEGIVEGMRRRHPQLMTLQQLADAGVDGFVSMLGWSLESIRKYSPTHVVIPSAHSATQAFLQTGGGAHFQKLSGAHLDLVRQCRPQAIAIPTDADRHPDHAGAHRLLRTAVFKAGLRRYVTAYEPWRAEWVCVGHAGEVPEPGALEQKDEDLLGSCEMLLADMREWITREIGLTTCLAETWRVIGDANRYVDGEAPWALKKTDPARMNTVLYVLADSVRRLALLTQPFIPDSSARMLDQLSVPNEAEARQFKALLGAPLRPGTPLPKPEGVFPHFVEDEA